MPELPEVETVKRGLAPALEGKRIEALILNRPDLRIPFPANMAERLTNAVIERITRRAKYLLFYMSNGEVLIAHLGMSGKMLEMPIEDYEPQKHDHVVMHFDNERCLIFNDARRFGLMTLVSQEGLAQHELIAHLGPEPLSDEFNEKYLHDALAKRAAPIKNTIMDQRVVVGVGNIYACEALFMSQISPFLPAKEVKQHAKTLISNIQTVLSAAIESGGSTLRDYVRSSGDMGYFQHHFQVYGREKESCERCSSEIRRAVQANRSTFYCYKCQNVK